MKKTSNARKYNKKSYKSTGRKVAVYKKSAPITFSGVKKLIDNRIIKNTESKTVNTSVGKVELYHNSYSYSYTLTSINLMPPQGDTDNSRDGTKIHLTGFTVRLIMGTKLDRLNTTYRITVVKVVKGRATSVYGDIFENITGNVMLDPINRDVCKVVYSKILRPKGISPVQFDANKEKTSFLKIYIPINRVVNFITDTSQENDIPFDLSLSICAYDTYGSLVSDNIAWVQTYIKTHYKDC